MSMMLTGGGTKYYEELLNRACDYGQCLNFNITLLSFRFTFTTIVLWIGCTKQMCISLCAEH